MIDSELDTEWTIHPFAFVLAPEAPEIEIDWEHSEYRFVRPEEVDALDHVPHLEKGLKRVVVGGEMEEVMKELGTDRVSGAGVLGGKALEGLGRVIRGTDLEGKKTKEEWWQGIKSVGWHLGVNARPSMAAAIQGAVWGALDEVLSRTSSEEMDLSSLKTLTEQIIKEKIEHRKYRTEKLQQHFVDYIEKDPTTRDDPKSDIPPDITILILSSSSTVLACLQAIIRSYPAQIRLIVLESRPNFEGVSLVNKILGSLDSEPETYLKVEIVSDASVASVVTRADYLVVGADKVGGGGEVWNKIGTRVAAVLAKTVSERCRVLVCCEVDKIVVVDEGGVGENGENNEAEEVMQAWPPAEREGVDGWMGEGRHTEAGKEGGNGRAGKAEVEVKVTNAYFEWTEGKWITAYITEEGELYKADLERVAKRKAELETSVFGDWKRIEE